MVQDWTIKDSHVLQADETWLDQIAKQLSLEKHNDESEIFKRQTYSVKTKRSRQIIFFAGSYLIAS